MKTNVTPHTLNDLRLPQATLDGRSRLPQNLLFGACAVLSALVVVLVWLS
jgi:hypothetical protein